MFSFDDFLEKHVVVTTGTGTFKGILIEHNYKNEESLKSWGQFAHCLLSTADGIIEIPDKDILSIQETVCYQEPV